MELNGVSDLRAIRSALGSRVNDAQGPADFCGADSAGWIGAAGSSEKPSSSVASAPITSLDDFVKSNEIPNVDVMCLSVAGAELPVLHGAKHLLNRELAPLYFAKPSAVRPADLAIIPLRSSGSWPIAVISSS